MDTISPGIYLHVPFCLQKCRYCDFFSITADRNAIERFYNSAMAVIAQVKDDSPWQAMSFSTIFFGGGTPSLLPTRMLAELLLRIRQSFHFTVGEPEISIEVNPATIDLQGLHSLRQAGFNRLSIGIQSLNDTELDIIGRRHSRDDALRVFHDARRAGFTNINLDLMYGLPEQTVEDWSLSMEAALSLDPEHLSIYELTVEPGTLLDQAVQKGELTLPDEDTILRITNRLYNRIENSPFSRYEISNYAKPGFECRHNLNYWHNGSYLGIGPASVSAHQGTRWSTAADLDRFIATAPSTPWALHNIEQLDQEAYFRETVIIGLRMINGIDIVHLRNRFGIDPIAYYGATLSDLFNKRLLIIQNKRLKLTAKGLPLANMVMAELV